MISTSAADAVRFNGNDSCSEVKAMKMMRLVLVLLAVGLLFGACVTTTGGSDKVTLTRGEMQSMLEKNQALLLDHFSVAAAKFYEETADSYYILSYEYFKLSKSLQEQGKTEQAENFKQISALCLEHQKDLQALAEKSREGLSPVTKAMQPKVPGADANGAVKPVAQTQQQRGAAAKPQATGSTGSAASGSSLVKPAMQSKNTQSDH